MTDTSKPLTPAKVGSNEWWRLIERFYRGAKDA